MCGINGLFFGNSSPMGTESTLELIGRMNNRIAHRGPDDEGTWCDPQQGVFLGHRRLSILDLSQAGHQPYKDEQGNALVYNGELYDHLSYRNKLHSRHTFASSSDTEVLFELLKESESKTLDLIEGMFAFAFWSAREKSLLLVRDRIGKKPLYFTGDHNRFAFSSEIKALTELPWHNPEPDTEALYHFLTYNQLPAPYTLFKGVKKLGPGEWMRVDSNGIRTGIYWRPKRGTDMIHGEDAYAEKLLEQLRSAVERRLVSDVPVGAFMSGGVDSTAIVSLMKQIGGGQIKTYSIGFDGAPGYDERALAREAANRIGTEHHEHIITKRNLIDDLPEIIRTFDEPLADPTAIPIHYLAKMAKANGTQVVLTGDGADELFAGYSSWVRYSKLAPIYSALQKSPLLVRQVNYRLCSVMSSEGSSLREFAYRLSRGQTIFWGGARAIKEHNKNEILSESMRASCRNLDSYSIIQQIDQEYESEFENDEHSDFINRMCYTGLRFQIPSKYLFRMDRLGMAHGVEVRNPFLDQRIIETAMSIPGEMKIRGGVPKWILKQALTTILPHETLYRKKMGFCMPIREWAGELLIEYVDSTIDQFVQQHDVFNAHEVKRLLNRFKKGDKQLTNTVWTLYFLMNWFDQWMRKK
jgi:asparagine synthase (glutamine-hydrolysing)